MRLRDAGARVKALEAQRPELTDSLRLPKMDPAELQARVRRIPAVRSAVAAGGMTPRGYALAADALMRALMVEQLRAAGVKAGIRAGEENVRFVQDHRAEINRVMAAAAP